MVREPKKTRTTTAHFGWVVWVMLIGACARSEADVSREFHAYVAERNSCAVTDDCVLVTADCPLGCWAAVNRAHQEAVVAKARELIDAYERFGQSCDYKCGFTTPVCEKGRCVANPR